MGRIVDPCRVYRAPPVTNPSPCLGRIQFVTKPSGANQPEIAEDPGIDELVAEALADLGHGTGPVGGRERLLQSVSALPDRYAPFFSRLSRMWDLDEAHVEALLEASARHRWQKVWPGIRYLNVSPGPGLSDARARLLRFDPGVRFPVHRHRGEEDVLVLEGSYTDSNGETVGAGDTQRMVAGSEHALVVSPEEPCVAAIVQRGLSFSAPWVRRAKRWFVR